MSMLEKNITNTMRDKIKYMNMMREYLVNVNEKDNKKNQYINKMFKEIKKKGRKKIKSRRRRKTKRKIRKKTKRKQSKKTRRRKTRRK